MSVNTFIGIDPGWKNLGLAILHQDTKTLELKPVKTLVMRPEGYRTLSEFVDEFDSIVTPLTSSLRGVTIERFVPYNNVFTAEAENINMVIGALRYYFGSKNGWATEPNMVRAIDWKMALVKELFKKRAFENPSQSLDKKFSIAAANACVDVGMDLETDHESDAVCLAALPVYVK